MQPGASAEDVHTAIAAFATPPEDGIFVANAGTIGRAFAHDSVEAIMAALAMEPDAFAADSLKAIATRSPTSLKLTLLLLRAGRKSRDLAECLERELGACRQILKTTDFYEGIRAAIIDKDRNPQWSPTASMRWTRRRWNASLRCPRQSCSTGKNGCVAPAQSLGVYSTIIASTSSNCPARSALRK